MSGDGVHPELGEKEPMLMMKEAKIGEDIQIEGSWSSFSFFSSLHHMRRILTFACGIFSFALFAATTFLLSMFNVNTLAIWTPNVVIFAGGLSQSIAGM